MRLAIGLLVCALGSAQVTYTISTVAGGTHCRDGWAATAAYLGAPEGLAVDAAGNVYISDSSDNRIRKIDRRGMISTVAGDGYAWFRGDGGPASLAQLSHPYGLALDSGGTLYVADLGNQRVRAISPDGVIRTVAGGGTVASGLPGDATKASLQQPRNVALDGAGNLYLSDFGANSVYRVTPAGIIQRVAESAGLRQPAGLAVDRDGALYIADSGNGRILQIDPSGRITTVGGEFTAPTGLAFDPGGNLYVVDKGAGLVVRLTPAPTAAVGTVLASPREVAFDSQGSLLVADVEGGVGAVRALAPGAIWKIVAGGTAFQPLGDGGPAEWAHIEVPSGVALGGDGALYISDRGNGRVRKVDGGVIQTVAGTGDPGDGGDGGPAIEAQLTDPAGLALDGAGNLFVVEGAGSRVRRVDPAGLIGRVAGLPGIGWGYSGDGGPATAARLGWPEGVAVDGRGGFYIADTGNNILRYVKPDGTIATVAGKAVPGYSGDGGPAGLAMLNGPRGVSLDGAGRVYVADTENSALRRIGVDGKIETLAGLDHPARAVVGPFGEIYVADAGNRILRLSADGKMVTVIAGTGIAGFSGDGGPAFQAQLADPADLALDAEGNLYVADRGNNVVRKLTRSGNPLPPGAADLGERRQLDGRAGGARRVGSVAERGARPARRRLLALRHDGLQRDATGPDPGAIRRHRRSAALCPREPDLPPGARRSGRARVHRN